MKKTDDVVRRYTSISAVIDILRRAELPLLDPQNWDDRNDRHFMTLYKEARKIGGLYALCATQCPETYHHWRVFTGTADGACMEIKRTEFEKLLDEIEGVRYGSVRYLTLKRVEKLTPAHALKLPFLKRWGFTDEDEFRVVAETTEPQRSAISIDFPLRLIRRINLNPWLPKKIAESVIDALKDVAPSIKVQRSFLIDSTRWKRAGDKIAGRPGGAIKLPKKKTTGGVGVTSKRGT